VLECEEERRDAETPSNSFKYFFRVFLGVSASAFILSFIGAAGVCYAIRLNAIVTIVD